MRDIVSNLRTADGPPRLGQQEYDETRQFQAEIVRRGVREGFFRKDLNPLTTAMLYQGLVDTMINRLLNHPEEDAGKLADQVAAFLFHGLCK